MRLKFILLVGFALASIYIIYLNPIVFTPRQAQSIPRNSEVFDWKIPNIAEDFDWKIRVITKESEEAQNYRISGDRRYSQDPELKNEFRELSIGGTLYETSVTDNDPKYESLKMYAQEQLDNNLVDLGWVGSIDYGDWYISGMAADGVLGSIYGLIKMDGTKIRTIAHFYETQVSSWEKGPGIDAKCPCTLNVKIFVSEIADLSTNTSMFVK